MGTSQSSKGPGGKVPLVPSWVPDLEPSSGASSGLADDAPASATTTPDQAAVQLAPARRFAEVRRNIGTFARTGGTAQMRQGLSHYVKTSYGGSGNSTRRHGGTIRTAASLYNILTPSYSGAGGGPVLERPFLQDRTAEEVINAVIEATRPVDGTQDAEASRASIHDALADLLVQFPDTDLLNLNEEQRLFAVERYISMDVFRRFQLDIGTTIQEKSPDARTALSRLKEVRDYIRETIAASFRQARTRGEQPNSANINRIIQAALRSAFDIFESYTL